jgi:serine/threonine-protein kinase
MVGMSADPVARLNTALEGRYRIERQLGEGGMATVYLADDLRHERKVALKVLKPELAAVVGAERFLAEIKTTANLQHPHILPLFDSGEVDGFLFYVMPYVEGETLRDRIDREKQLPVDEAIGIAVAVASALEYAHQHGVVHRDIKPANILIQAGQPVVGDFGIALAVGSAGGARLTETGLSVGTPFYMSPEQATGDQLVGPATDIYALGAVLYELLTGDPPYTGSTAQAVLGKIIQGVPVSASAIRRSIPANVDAGVRKALEKLPADRFTSAEGFAKALGDRSFRHGEEAAVGAAAAAGPWRTGALVASVLALLFAGVAAWALSRPAPTLPIERYSLGTSDDRQLDNHFGLASDGSLFVYRDLTPDGLLGLFLRTWDSLEPTLIPGTTEGAPQSPAISPGNDEVAYIAGGQLRVAPLRGGVSRTLSDSAACCTHWGLDGYIYYMGQPGQSTYRISATGGARERITESEEDEGLHFGFALAPGKNGGVFSVAGSPPRIETIHFESGERGVLTVGSQANVLSAGYLVFGSAEGEILAAPFDLDRLELTGSPVPLVEGVVLANAGPMFRVSDTGTLVYWSGSGASNLKEFVWVTRDGVATPVDPGWTFNRGDTNAGWSLSPDGSRLAFRELTEDGYDIWIKELDDGPRSRLTFDEGGERMPRWSPDGRTVTFLSSREGNYDVWSMPADGTGPPTLLFDHERFLSQGFWSPDGEWLVLRTGGQSNVIGGRDIFTVRPGVDSAAQPLLEAAYDEGAPAVSHDGRWLAYNSTETGQYEVFLRPFPDVSAGKIQVSTDGGAGPLWSHSGSELYFVNGGNEMIAAHLDYSGGQPRVVEREVLFEVPATWEGTVPNNYITGLYDITADDQRFLMVRPYQDAADQGPQNELIVVKNWLQELDGRVGN